ncbi:hypothetical protein EII12_06060 [Buchananella hordeovulneris]|uniref:hypothetical protein n=1 Tax=Buchananella hordeovulneris TaxID=52770 RepID=UPI000F5E220B|nr:hypothetical protein [Buchananella hordeovulneris]RRD52107.1 hypothetical protein EII12_06060 [Buchananella hordeovulneris]
MYGEKTIGYRLPETVYILEATDLKPQQPPQASIRIITKTAGTDHLYKLKIRHRFKNAAVTMLLNAELVLEKAEIHLASNLQQTTHWSRTIAATSGLIGAVTQLIPPTIVPTMSPEKIGEQMPTHLEQMRPTLIDLILEDMNKIQTDPSTHSLYEIHERVRLLDTLADIEHKRASSKQGSTRRLSIKSDLLPIIEKRGKQHFITIPTEARSFFDATKQFIAYLDKTESAAPQPDSKHLLLRTPLTKELAVVAAAPDPNNKYRNDEISPVNITSIVPVTTFSSESPHESVKINYRWQAPYSIIVAHQLTQ